MLELLFLQQDNLSWFGNVDSNTTQTFGLTDESKNFRVEVDIELVVVWVTNDEGGLETSFRFLDLDCPLLSPQILVREKSISDFVERLNWLLELTKLGKFWWELFHRYRNPVEEMTRPCDGTRDSGQISHDRWWALMLLILFFDLGDLKRVVCEQDSVLLV